MDEKTDSTSPTEIGIEALHRWRADACGLVYAGMTFTRIEVVQHPAGGCALSILRDLDVLARVQLGPEEAVHLSQLLARQACHVR